ncbi:uncharacterized protein G2W53_030228 [Senna tora]|uniref:Uncharacterized protein n=1 Tax=Senna tora TaxID=362788 RepID=A0A834WGI6_9FABA|nr:uncharacterized protein G2W53_030228 [Senna tora]
MLKKALKVKLPVGVSFYKPSLNPTTSNSTTSTKTPKIDELSPKALLL